jgi:hypothetical protein
VFEGPRSAGTAVAQQVTVTLDPVSRSFPARPGETVSFGPDTATAAGR